jgi:hypothetical protein
MRRFKFIFISLLFGAGCTKPYAPPAVRNVPAVLIVEGVINCGNDSDDYTSIRLSRTVGLSGSTSSNAILGATVTIEGDNNTIYYLTDVNTGYYTSPPLNLDVTHKYRLRIKTTDLNVNNVYLSDYVPVKITPPIDSIGFTITSNGLQLYANAHDVTNSTRYYRWDYTETWAFHSQYYSNYYSNGSGLVYRSADQQIYNCFGSDISSDIVLGSSAKLRNDVIYQNPVAIIAPTSEKIETKYSILLNQYALTPDAFTFWTSLKKNTEQLGSIFDAQPSNIAGNIHNVYNPGEIVIGYVSASTISTKRIFISNSQLPASWRPVYPYQCVQDTFPVSSDQALTKLPASEIPTTGIMSQGILVAYLGADAQCVDCTLRGSTNVPNFWR